MKLFNGNLHRVRIVFAVVIVVLCVGAVYLGTKRDTIPESEDRDDYFVTERDTMPVSEDRDEVFREYIASELEETLKSSKVILSCNVDFEVDDNAITKVYLTLDCAEILRPETEDSIKQTVARAINLPTDDISISY